MKNTLLLLALLIVNYSCNSIENQADIESMTIDSITIKNAINPTITNCLEDIHVLLSDSVLLYWASIASDSFLLAEHEGNTRVMISKTGRYYYSYNKGSINSLENYFNTELVYYKTLSVDELALLINTLVDLEISNLPAKVNSPNILSSNPIRKYIYVDNDKLKVCTMFEVHNELTSKIEALIKEL